MKLRLPGVLVDDNGNELPCDIVCDVDDYSIIGAQLNGSAGLVEFSATITRASGFEPRPGWREDYERTKHLRSSPLPGTEEKT